MNILDSVLPQINQLTPYTPGKPVEEVERELGISHSVKLASNENPLGCSEKVTQLLSSSSELCSIYPDANAFYLKQKLAQQLGVTPDHITIGNGSNDVLDIIARTFLAQGKQAIFSKYAFLVYPLVTVACGATPIVTPALSRDSDQAYGHDLNAMLNGITEHTSIIFIANPNNPTGTWLNQKELYGFLQQVPSHIAVVLDEAYFEYVTEDEYPDCVQWLNEFPNLILTRTFSKIYGLAGLRLGYSISSPEIGNLLNRVRQPFNGNSIALAAAILALEDQSFVEKSAQNNLHSLDMMKQYCHKKGLFYMTSVGNFLTIEFPDQAMHVYNQLLQKGLIVRPVANYGLNDFLRISMGTEPQMNQLMRTLDELL